MKFFLYKIFIFFLILLIIVLSSITLTELIVNNKCLNQSVIYKIKELKKPDNNIIIAGDSRAERQLIPNVIDANGFNSINIATSSCDLITLSNAIDEYITLKPNNILIISASSWQINDGAINPGYLSLNCFQQLKISERISIYKNNLDELLRLEKSLLMNAITAILKVRKGNYDKLIIKNKGFHPIKNTLNPNSLNINQLIHTHSWYKNLNNNGARYRIFKKALKKLSKNKGLIIIYNPPVSPFWKEITKNTFIDYAEKDYSKKLKSLCMKYDNIIFLDFYNKDIKALNNDFYYDVQHLNNEGAILFTKLILKELTKYERTTKNIVHLADSAKNEDDSNK